MSRGRWGMVLLLLTALLIGLGQPQGSTRTQAPGCDLLEGLEPVEVEALSAAGEERVGTGYRGPAGDLLVPLRGLVEPLVAGSGGLYWDQERRTVSLLGPSDVLSVHLPAGRAVGDQAVLNGGVIRLRSVACGDQVYLPLTLLVDLLQLDVIRTGAEAVRLVPR